MTDTKNAPVLYEIGLMDTVIPVVGQTSLICHRFAESNIRQIEDKQQKRASRAKEARDPEQECLDSLYLIDDRPTYGFPAIAFKNAIVSACRHTSMTMSSAKGAFHVLGDLLEIKHPSGGPAQWNMRVDRVVIGRGITNIAYRPEFREWRIDIPIRFNEDVISLEQLLNLVEIAGFAVGVGDWRPECNGNHGMFSVLRG